MIRILHGDCRDVLKTLPAQSVQCCVTSPPYFNLRAYLPDGHPDKGREIGAEPTLNQFVAAMVEVFGAVRNVLRDDGVVFLNLGDSYASSGVAGPNSGLAALADKYAPRINPRNPNRDDTGGVPRPAKQIPSGLKPKDLIGVPWRVAIALQADGWYLRSDIIWHKPNPMPESVTDRPTSAHEHVFLLTKRDRYFYDAEAIAEDAFSEGRIPGGNRKVDSSRNDAKRDMSIPVGATRNARNVWTIATQPFSGAHFATMPPELAERCILAGSKPGDTILDPFGGAGTTGLVADRLQRDAVLIELNPEYIDIQRRRVTNDAGLFAEIA